MYRIIAATIAALCLWTLGAQAAEPLRAVARLDVERSGVVDTKRGAQIDMAMNVSVPFRVFTLTEPARVILDFQEIDWAGIAVDRWTDAHAIRSVRYGTYRVGWSRMVLDLSRPMVVETVEMTTGDAPHLQVRLGQATPEEFAIASGAPPGVIWATTVTEDPKVTGNGPLRVAIDPGHGGIDPGASRNGVLEKDIALAFSRDLRDQLTKESGFSVFLTRNSDEYVSLRDRVRRAQQAEADVFLSIHANTVTEGDASGATIYSLSDKASDAASAKLAELENRADISAGLDLTTEDDEIAKVLIDMARTETNARTAHFAAALVESMQNSTGTIRSRPHRSAGFKVLKAPDMPSLLLELGFLSNARDRTNMQDAAWRQLAAGGVVAALKSWSSSDRILSRLVMK